MMRTSFHTGLALLAGLGLFAAATLEGCSGGSSGGSSGGAAPAATDDGTVTVAVTDAASDDVDVFEVDVVAFRFARRDGAMVEVLSQRARVDFAQLVSVSQVIAAASLPQGHYTSAYMTLDFTGAMARIRGAATPATLLDGQGGALSGQQELQVVLPGGGFTVGPRKGVFAEVDFDLDQSLSVDAAANTIAVDTVLYASIDPANPKDARVPGLTSGFTSGGSSFSLDVRLGLGLVSRGTLTVNTDASTVFDLDGQVLTGAAGYADLAARGDRTLVVAAGRVDPVTRTLTARRVVLLPQHLDEVGGLVVARNGGAGQDATLTLRGVSVRRAGGAVTFNDTVTLRASFAETKVNRRGVAAGALTTDAINVGQRILAYGTFSGSTLDLTAPGAGFVRLVETDVAGEVTTAPAGGRLDVDLTRIGRRPIAAFDFSVGGVAQADPDHYQVDTGGLSLSTLAAGSAVVARGFVAPVSSTTPAGATFVADSAIDRTDAGSLLRAAWVPASTAAIASTQNAEVTLDVSAATFAQVERGLVVPTPLTGSVTVAGASGPGFYAVRQGLKLTLFRGYADFVAHLEQERAAGARVHAFRALGRWDAAASRLTATRAVANLR